MGRKRQEGPFSKLMKSEPGQVLKIRSIREEALHDACARELTKPHFSAACTAQFYSRVDGETLDLVGLINTLDQQVTAVNAGDTTGLEATLVTQTRTLDLIFNNL